MLVACLARRHGAVGVCSSWSRSWPLFCDRVSSAAIRSCRVIGVPPVLAGFSDLFHQDRVPRLRHIGLPIDLVGEGAEWRQVDRLDRQAARFQGVGDTLFISEAAIVVEFGCFLGGSLNRSLLLG